MQLRLNGTSRCSKLFVSFFVVFVSLWLTLTPVIR
jgi:hypothetical protein